MTTASPWVQQAFSGVLVAVLTLQPQAGAAAAAAPPLQIVDLPREHRLLVSMGPLALASAEGRLAAVDTFMSGGRMARAAIVYRFTIELLDSAGQQIGSGAAWQATLFAGGTGDPAYPGLRPLAQFGAHASDVTLPKPLGYRLDAGDSLLIVAEMMNAQAGSRSPRYLRLSLEYEAVDRPASRLPVLPLHARSSAAHLVDEGRADAGALRRSWEWQPEVGGRILAIAGLPLESASQLVLEDVASGEVLWHGVAGGAESRGFGRPSQVVRLGVAVQAGRRYRLTATSTAPIAAVAATGADSLCAMVLPSREPAAVVLANR